MKNIIWFTGLPSSGKTVLSGMLVDKLRNINLPVVLLDGDNVRRIISHYGYTIEDRIKQMKLVSGVGKLISNSDIYSVISTVSSPTICGVSFDNVFEVYLKCSLFVCEKRDVKGYYAKARRGNIVDFVGVTINYIAPTSYDLMVNTDINTVNESFDIIISRLFNE